jgi:putative ABC transport system substrate-binding protein
MRRRELLALLGGAAFAWPLVALAQQRTKPWVIGFIGGGETLPTESPFNGLARGMRELGYAEGRDFVIEWRSARGHYERFPEIAQQLVRDNVDVIVLGTSAAVRPAQQVSKTTPIVMAYSTDPVGSGFVASFSEPGGNVTGLAGSSADTSPKHLELILKVVPALSRIGLIGNPDNPNQSPILKSTQDAANKIGLASLPVDVRKPEDLDFAFARLSKERVQAIKVIPDALFFAQRERVAELALRHKLPSIFVQRESAAAGGLMSYGESLTEFYRRAATFVDKILKGAKPRDLPIEQPPTFQFVINLKTAKALGLDIPQTLLAIADEVIE